MTFAPAGVFWGVVLISVGIAALFITAWEIYGRAFADYLPAAELPPLSGQSLPDTGIDSDVSVEPSPGADT